jgi:hypothetical protein
MQLMMWVEQLSYSTWIRESNSLWAFPMFLFAHTLGMSIVAGGAAMISMALLGLWPNTSLRPLDRLYPYMMVGFALNAFTGLSIFMKDATVYSRNLDLYLKLLFIAVGMILLFRIRRTVLRAPDVDNRPLPPAARILAWATLFCWLGAIVTGRLIAYVGPVAGL